MDSSFFFCSFPFFFLFFFFFFLLLFERLSFARGTLRIISYRDKTAAIASKFLFVRSLNFVIAAAKPRRSRNNFSRNLLWLLTLGAVRQFKNNFSCEWTFSETHSGGKNEFTKQTKGCYNLKSNDLRPIRHGSFIPRRHGGLCSRREVRVVSSRIMFRNRKYRGNESTLLNFVFRR